MPNATPMNMPFAGTLSGAWWLRALHVRVVPALVAAAIVALGSAAVGFARLFGR